MAIFISLRKDDAKRNLGGYKAHLTCTREAADKAIKAVEELPYQVLRRTNIYFVSM